ncbi:hypothetical protein FSP39_017761 [Pinctada imbricata]|uniref:HAT C-terminal dimerisation domain-containing protein n=1 Tax=Pinctada imbricata TaxID=66713 RepID=A0AA88XIP5_PINIB|nr:hypothetical protein FSP39_017761 [Pinctada imbricata]
MKEAHSDSSLIRAIKDKISTDLQQRYTDEDTLQFLLESCLLDPRFKTLPYLDESRRNDVVSSLKMKCSLFDTKLAVVKQEPTQDSEVGANTPPGPPLPSLPSTSTTQNQEINNNDEPPSKKCALEKLFCDVFVTKVEPPKSAYEKFSCEMESYRSENAINLQSDPLKWWKEHNFQYPLLAKMAKYYLGIPATSVPSERVFSAAGEIVSAQRACLREIMLISSFS